MTPTTLHLGSLGCLAHYQAENAEGQPLPPAATPTWAVDDPTKVELDPTADGLTCQVKPLAVTTNPVTVSATDGKAGSSVQFTVFDNVETQAVITVDPEQFPPPPSTPAAPAKTS